jgi:hypothetical protein
MPAFITLTPHPLTVSLPAKGHLTQPLWTAVDISRFDILDLELGVLFLSNKVSATVSVVTSMQNQFEGNGNGQGGGDWLLAGEFVTPVVGQQNAPPTPQWQKLSISSQGREGPLLKYVRWRVDLSAAGTVTFFIRGLARRSSR